MNDSTLEFLRIWSSDYSTMVSALSALAMAAVDDVRDFMTMRRTRTGLFAEEPAVDEKAWLAYYNSPKSLERALWALTAPAKDDVDVPSVLDALRNPRGKRPEANLQAYGLILDCMTDGSSAKASELRRRTFAQIEEADGDDVTQAPLAFCLWVYLPCWFRYGVTPTKLIRSVSSGGTSAEKAVERLVRLDPRVARHPAVERWVRADPALAPFRRGKLRKWAGRTPFDKEKSDSHWLRLIAGYLSAISELTDERILAPELRSLVGALGDEIPADLQEYLLNRTDDDWSREIRRQRGRFELGVTKPDRSTLRLVREMAQRCA
ncbi:MAG: hypothetical protein KF847_20745 [Pirellulales bacterium]|nr:hypothetical protein [Pirellulales bacterium]